MTIVCDTNVIYAAAVRNDAHHDTCAELFRADEPVVVPAPVLVELEWLSRARGVPLVARNALLSVEQGGLPVADLELSDYRRVRSLMIDYEDLPLDLVDASVVAVAERLGETRVATLDRRHFAVVRPAHTPAFTLLPAAS